MNLTTPSALETWQSLSHRQRCRVIGGVRHEIARECDELARLCQSPQRPDLVDTVSAELMPLCAALKRIGRRGPSILRTRRQGLLGRPAWLWGVRSKIERVARGRVLVLAAWNYPILLPGVQIAQALAAGNGVYLKPAPGCEAVTQRLASLFVKAGVPEEVLTVLSSDTQAAIDRIELGVELVVLTGSSGTGRAVMRQCAERLTPTILELSGSDAVVIGKHADIAHAAKAIRFGLKFNSGATCIGPRRIFVERSVEATLIKHLRSEFADAEPMTLHSAAISMATQMISDTLARGAVNVLASDERLVTAANDQVVPTILSPVSADWPVANCDMFAPIASLLTFSTDHEVISIINRCRYRLAASVFGDVRWAESLASRLDVGTVTVNDLIFPTADPRLPFGGRGDSGFGVTRGDQGLFEMTVPRVISRHRGRLFLHLAKQSPSDFDTLAGALTLTHARFRDKWLGLQRIWNGVKFKNAANSTTKSSYASPHLPNVSSPTETKS